MQQEMNLTVNRRCFWERVRRTPQAFKIWKFWWNISYICARRYFCAQFLNSRQIFIIFKKTVHAESRRAFFSASAAWQKNRRRRRSAAACITAPRPSYCIKCRILKYNPKYYGKILNNLTSLIITTLPSYYTILPKIHLDWSRLTQLYKIWSFLDPYCTRIII